MKKLLLLLAVALLPIFSSCSKDDLTTKSSWTFYLTQVTSISPSMKGYPQTINTTSTSSNLTEAEAEQVVKQLTTSSTSTTAGYTITIKTTVTKKRN